MISEKDLKELLDYSSQDGVLSVYLNTNPTEVQAEAAKIQLRNLLRTVDQPEDVQAVERISTWSTIGLRKGGYVFRPTRDFSKLTSSTSLCLTKSLSATDRLFAPWFS